MTITTRLYTAIYGKKVGEDSFGNLYFTEKRPDKSARARRWVIYKGSAEASKIPPQWHGWLHYTLDVPPSQRNIQPHSWEKPHLPNLSGTLGEYLPAGHIIRGGKRAASSADYESWKP